jgi:hypothetical protein
MQNRTTQSGGGQKNHEEGAAKNKGCEWLYGLSRPIPQICVVLITIRRPSRLLVKL